MKSILLLVCLGIGVCVAAQKQFNVLDWKAEYSLNTYLVQQLHRQYAERKANFHKALGSRSALERYIRAAQNRYFALLGTMPAKSPLNAAVSGVIKEPGYRIEKITYESFASHHVTANLYVPQGKGPFPAVLLFCGHEDVSKATASYQQTAILFARNGYVVLVVDPISQSERYQLLDSLGKPLTRGGTTEHTLLNETSNLVGLSAPAYELWDNVRSLDYLVTRSEVDTSRIGCLGNSGGGMQTIYFAGYDKRIKVAAPCSYVATRERTMEMTGPADGCAQMPGEGKAQLELADYLLMAAPKPILVLAGRYDFIDYTGAEEAYAELSKAYTVLGAKEKVAMFTVDDGHGISQPKREAAVRWFNRWLKNDNSPVTETSARLHAPADLAAGNGQVAATFDGEVSVADYNLSRYKAYASSRIEWSRKATDFARAVAQFAGINDTRRTVSLENKDSVRYGGQLFLKKIIRKQDEVPLPVLIAHPAVPGNKLWIACSDKGKAAMAVSDSIRMLISAGYTVILCDLRGTGETEDRADQNDPKYYNREYRNAMLALHTGRSLVSQRATDILTVLDMIRQDPSLAPAAVTLQASGIGVLPALHAAVLDKKIARLHLSSRIRSFQDILQDPTGRDWYSYVIPGVAAAYDISDLVRAIGEERVVWER